MYCFVILFRFHLQFKSLYCFVCFCLVFLLISGAFFYVAYNIKVYTLILREYKDDNYENNAFLCIASF